MVRAWVLFAATIFAASTASAQLLAQGKPPVGHWLGSPEDGEAVMDASPNGNHGTISTGKGARSQTGPFKSGFECNESHIDLGTGPALTELHERTYAAWILPKSWGEMDEGRVLSLGFNNSFGIKGEYRGLLFRKHYAETNGLWRSAEGAVELGKWQFIAVTFDPASTKPPVFFVNGIESPCEAYQEPKGNIMPEAGAPLTIGGDPGDTRNFDGTISNIRVYNRVLSQIEIERLAEEPSYRLVFAE